MLKNIRFFLAVEMANLPKTTFYEFINDSQWDIFKKESDNFQKKSFAYKSYGNNHPDQDSSDYEDHGFKSEISISQNFILHYIVNS